MDSTNKLAYMISRPPTSNIISLEIVMHMDNFNHDAYKVEYMKYEDFKEVF